MAESKVEVGGTVTYDISGKKLVLKPASVGKMKKAMLALRADGDTFDKIVAHLAVIFDNGENAFATTQWLEDNVTMPQANQIIEDMRAVNGMPSLNFSQGGPVKEKELEENPAPATPSA